MSCQSIPRHSVLLNVLSSSSCFGRHCTELSELQEKLIWKTPTASSCYLCPVPLVMVQGRPSSAFEMPPTTVRNMTQDVLLSQGGPRDAAVNFDTYRILQQHRAASLPRHGFLVGLCLQTAVKKWQVLERTSQTAYLTQTSNHVITLNHCRHHYSPPT